MTQILSFNSCIGEYTNKIQDQYPDIVIVDPIDVSPIVSQGLWVDKHGTLNNQDFAEVAMRTREFREWIADFLSQGGLLVVLLRPSNEIYHKRHRDMRLTNYDWLQLTDGVPIITSQCSPTAIVPTNFGDDSPFGEYLREYGRKIDLVARGHFLSLAVTEDKDAISFLMEEGQSKIVFVPPPIGSKSKELLKDACRKALHVENWPPTTPPQKFNPSWLDKYPLPEMNILEAALAERIALIHQLELENERNYKQLFQVEQIHKGLFGGCIFMTNHVAASVISQWGVRVSTQGEIIELVSGERKGILLASVSDGETLVWVGEKLKRLCDKNNAKGILVINAHRQISPEERPEKLVSPSLEKFANENNLALISVVEIYKSHCLGRKELMDFLWEKSGIITPPYEKWEKEQQNVVVEEAKPAGIINIIEEPKAIVEEPVVDPEIEQEIEQDTASEESTSDDG